MAVAAFGIAVVVAAARVYVGWSWPSEAIASTLLGGVWVLVFVVAWHTRDRLREPPDPATAQEAATGSRAPAPGR